ncbi:MAG: type II toxin-antitoxin system CcdA family antitoxin [Sphingopyxis sp.]
MNKAYRFTASRKPTNVTLPADLVSEAKRLGINVSQACEAGLVDEVRKMLGEEWKRENREAMESSNEYVRKHGLPLARHRDRLWRS